MTSAQRPARWQIVDKHRTHLCIDGQGSRFWGQGMTRSSDATHWPLRSPGFLSRRAPARMSPARAASLGPVTTPRGGGRNPRRQLETSQARVMPTCSHSALMLVCRTSVGKSRSHRGSVKTSVVDVVRFIWAFAIATANFCSKIICWK
jgi:hypothetical protein